MITNMMALFCLFEIGVYRYNAATMQKNIRFSQLAIAETFTDLSALNNQRQYDLGKKMKKT